MTTERWRSMDATDRFQFQEWFRREMSDRHHRGIAKYHEGEARPTFKGEPLTQAIEEALDLVFYLWVEQRRQLELENDH